ncbi:MAG: aldose 1-epimerase, partial [Solirubrobacteraceae bacterium]
MLSLFGALRVAFCAAVLALLVASPAGAATKHHGHARHHGGGLSVTSEPFGTLPPTIDAGKAVDRYTLTNSNGMTVRILTYGGIIQELDVPDRNGNETNVTLGFKDLAGYTSDAYLKSNPYFGALIGRYGNRIGPVGGVAGQPPGFVLNGNTYTLDNNNNGASLHGGFEGFNRKVWTAAPIDTGDTVGVKLTLD